VHHQPSRDSIRRGGLGRQRRGIGGYFRRRHARKGRSRRGDLAAALSAKHAEDLYLACACAAGIPEALMLLAARFRATIETAVARIDASRTFVDEVRQELHERLFRAEDQQPPKIATYKGNGPLGGWLAVVAQRTALNLLEKEAARERAHRGAAAEQLVSDLDPELRYLKQRYKDEFERAFVEAMERLTARERTLLGLKIVAGLTLERIGLIHQVDLSTASRWIASARNKLMKATEEILGQRLGLSLTEMQSLARLIASQIDISIARLLAPADGAPTKRDDAV
jgi:RNA polymerase sigma-70 factor, ECF subfamily